MSTLPATRSGSPRSARATTSTPPGVRRPRAAVASCEEALARFESEALSAELDEAASDARPSLRAVDGADA